MAGKSVESHIQGSHHHLETGIDNGENTANAVPNEKFARRRRSSEADMSTNSCSGSVDSTNKQSVSLEDPVAVVESEVTGVASIAVDATGVHDGKVASGDGPSTSYAKSLIFDRGGSNSLFAAGKFYKHNNNYDDNTKKHVLQEPDEVSDISHSESESEEDYTRSGATPGLKRPRFSSHRNSHKNHTICSVITNASDHGSIHSLRENVDRLLMSSANSMGGGGGRTMTDHSRTNGRQCMQKSVSPTVARMLYDENYYKSSDWLRFVPRRNSSFAENESFSSSQDHLSSALGSHSSPGMHQPHHSHGVPLTPDRYYRGFDNTRIRVGFHPGNARRTVVRRQENDHNLHGGEVTSHHGIMTAPPTCGFHVDNFRMRHPNLVIDTPIDEEVAVGGREVPTVLCSNAKTVSSSDVSNMSLLPKEINCDQNNESCQVVPEEEGEVPRELCTLSAAKPRSSPRSHRQRRKVASLSIFSPQRSHRPSRMSASHRPKPHRPSFHQHT
eukprot:CCRYP_007680-RA/>CCRYP_007680-RA protein AED:0.01 eAED:0.01 QI:283/1/1/1/1/1/2/1604/498